MSANGNDCWEQKLEWYKERGRDMHGSILFLNKKIQVLLLIIIYVCIYVSMYACKDQLSKP